MVRGPSPLTYILLALNVAAALLPILLGGGGQEMLLVEGGFWPARVTAEWAGEPMPGAEGLDWTVPVWLTPLTAAFLHSGIAHLVLNMVMLVFIGRQVEVVLGAGPFAGLYLLGIYAAAAVQYAVGPGDVIPMVGASGAVSALLGTYVLLFARRRVSPIGPISSHWVRVVWLFAAWLILNVAVSLVMASSGLNIAVAAHAGGFAFGLLVARPLARTVYARRMREGGYSPPGGRSGSSNR